MVYIGGRFRVLPRLCGQLQAGMRSFLRVDSALSPAGRSCADRRAAAFPRYLSFSAPFFKLPSTSASGLVAVRRGGSNPHTQVSFPLRHCLHMSLLNKIFRGVQLSDSVFLALVESDVRAVEITTV